MSEANQGIPLPQALTRIAKVPGWPNRWMTVGQIHQLLDMLGFWEKCGIAHLAETERRTALVDCLESMDAEGFRAWRQIGGEYKHVSQMTDEDRQSLEEWTYDYLAWFVKEVRRYERTGEPFPLPKRNLREPVLTHDQFLAQTEEAVAELRRLNAALDLIPEASFSGTQGDKSASGRAVDRAGLAVSLLHETNKKFTEGVWEINNYPEDGRQVRRLSVSIITLFQYHVPDPE